MTDLTSPWLLAVVGTLLVVLSVLSILDRPRPRRQALQLLARGGRVLGVAALAVLMFALCPQQPVPLLHLVGRRDRLPTQGVTRTVGKAAAARTTTVPGPGLAGARTPAVLPPLPNPGQRLQSYTLTSPNLSGPAQVLVQLPAGYDPRSARTYPVILGLHGYPSSPSSFLRTEIVSVQDRLTTQHLLAPSIVVIPEINVPRTLDTECVNGGPGHPQVETWLARDVPHWVTQHFRARTDRLSWATIGYSFGGWCAASLGLLHPDVFGAAVIFAGYFRPDFGTSYVPPRSTLSRYDLIRLEQHSPVPLSMWVMTSREDRVSCHSTAQFVQAARAPTAVTSTVLLHGGHRNAVWEPLIPHALTWLSRALPGFRP